MSQSFQLLPSGDIENDGWTLVGSSVTEVWEVLSALEDDCHIQSPTHRGSAGVSFPIDAQDLPDGAIIDSVTVFIRMKTGSGTGVRTVTVNVLSSENMSRYTSRTLSATSAFTTFEVGTYTKDPLGKDWDIHRINKLRLRVFCLNNLFDAIRISELYVRVNFHTRPKVTILEPTGTSVSPSPRVKWTYSQAEGEPQAQAQIKIFTAAQVAAVNTFNPDTATPISVESLGSNASFRIYNPVYAAQFSWYESWWQREYGGNAAYGGYGGTPGGPNSNDPGGNTVSPATGGSSNTNVDTRQDQVFDITIQGSANEYVIPTSLNNNGYCVYLRAWSQHGAKSQWAKRDFIINAPSPAVPGDDNAGDSGTPGVGIPSAIPDTYTSSAQIRIRDASNLLSVQQADFEIPSDPLEYTETNCLVARSTAQAFGEGEASMSLTASSAGDMIAETTLIEVAPGIPVTLRAQGKTAVTARTCSLYATFYDDDFNLITTSDTASITDSTSTWTEAVLNIALTPVNTVYMKLHYKVASAASSEVHYVDHCGIMPGVSSAWTDGGHQSNNLLTSFLATGDDPASSTDLWTQANIATTAQRVTTTGTGAHGSKSNQMTYVTPGSQIGYRSTGTVFTTPTAGTNFTLNKPAGTTDNDLLLAFVTSTESGTIVPPAGWTTANTASVNDGSTDTALWILKRTATASDPSSWTTGKVTQSSSRRSAVVVCYSGAAHADDQFIADSVRTDTSGSATHVTQTVNNTDPNAWRVAAFAASDDASGATFTANVTAPGTSSAAPIRFVSASSKWVQQSQTTSYTINKPPNMQSGDLMIATVVISGYVGTVNAPSGWTLVRWMHQQFGTSLGDAHSGDVTMAIFKRTATGAEANSWSATHTNWGQPKVTQVVAYRNCADASQQFIAENFAADTNFSKVTTPSVTNTDSRAWRLCIFGATTPYESSWTSGDNQERADSSTNLSSFPDAVLSVSDSNGQIATGSHKRTGIINSVSTSTSNVPSGNFFAGLGWIGIIKPLSAPPAQGSNETERVDNNNGSSNPWLSTAIYDSNGTIPSGTSAVYGQFSPGSGTAANSMVSWIGVIKPASSTPQGVASVTTSTWVDISDMDASIMPLARNKMTVIASFLGSDDGTPLLGLEFARANQVITESTAEGKVFNTTTWTKSWAAFDVPLGTTRVRPVLSVTGRIGGNTVMFDRVGVMLGAPEQNEVPVWRNGTARPEHPVWTSAKIQYTDDSGVGYHSWRDLPGQRLLPPIFRNSTGLLTYVDHSVVPLNVRKYRVQTKSYGLLGECFDSGWGPDSNEVSFTALNWWLKDFSDLSTALRMRVKYEDVQVDTDNTAAVYQPLGEDYPVVLTEGYKADSLTLSIFCDRQEEALLYRLLRSNRTLLLQSDTDYAWWVRPVETLSVVNLAVSHLRRTTDPIKVVTVKFIQVKPEE